MKSYNKILVIQTAFIGDLVLTLPLIQVLKNNLPQSQIDLLCIPSTSGIVENNPYIAEVILYDKKGDDKLTGIISKIRSRKYDLVISPHRSFRSTLISFFSGAKTTVTFDRTAGSYLYKKKVKYRDDLHEIQRNLKLLEPLGIEQNDIIRPELFPAEDTQQCMKELIYNLDIKEEDRIVTIAPGSVWNTKRYPLEKFTEVVKLLTEQGSKVFIVGGKNDVDAGEYIAVNNEGRDVFDLTGELSLLESAELIKNSHALITNDSAPLHIANAVGTKVIALFGSTIPGFGFFPYGKDDTVLEINGLKCRPCSIHGGEKCPIGTFECMYKISPEEVVNTVSS